ncbi:MAG: hypothetical protein PHV20_05805 [Bacteroidales bacterium]|nr:hypothetical protein [Bacteroidales bacterium]
MKTIFFLLSLIMITASCSNELDNQHNNDNSRLIFSSFSEFNRTYKELSKLSSAELKSWANIKNHTTLLNSNDSIISEYSNVVKTLFNDKSEIIINDSIIWLHAGVLYAYSMQEYKHKNQIDNGRIVGNLYIQKINNPTLRSTISGGNLINHQKQFSQYSYKKLGGVTQYVGGLRKYVNEIYLEGFSYQELPIPMPRTYYEYMRFRAKLEYKGSSGWKPAGEPRRIVINLMGQANFSVYANNIPISTGVQTFQYSGNQDIILADWINATSVPISRYWTFSLNGTVYQHVEGDLQSNEWTDSTSW